MKQTSFAIKWLPLIVILVLSSCSSNVYRRVKEYEKAGNSVVAFGDSKTAKDPRWKQSEKPYIVYVDNRQVYLDLLDSQIPIMKTDSLYDYIFYSANDYDDYLGIVGVNSPEMSIHEYLCFVDGLSFPLDYESTPDFSIIDGFGLIIKNWDHKSRDCFFNFQDKKFYQGDYMTPTDDGRVSFSFIGNLTEGSVVPIAYFLDDYTAGILCGSGKNYGDYRASGCYLTKEGPIVDDDSHVYMSKVGGIYPAKNWASRETFSAIADNIQYHILFDYAYTPDELNQMLCNTVKYQDILSRPILFKAEPKSINYSSRTGYKYYIECENCIDSDYKVRGVTLVSNDERFTEMTYPTNRSIYFIGTLDVDHALVWSSFTFYDVELIR